MMLTITLESSCWSFGNGVKNENSVREYFFLILFLSLFCFDEFKKHFSSTRQFVVNFWHLIKFTTCSKHVLEATYVRHGSINSMAYSGRFLFVLALLFFTELVVLFRRKTCTRQFELMKQKVTKSAWHASIIVGGYFQISCILIKKSEFLKEISSGFIFFSGCEDRRTCLSLLVVLILVFDSCFFDAVLFSDSPSGHVQPKHIHSVSAVPAQNKQFPNSSRCDVQKASVLRSTLGINQTIFFGAAEQ